MLKRILLNDQKVKKANLVTHEKVFKITLLRRYFGSV